MALFTRIISGVLFVVCYSLIPTISHAENYYWSLGLSGVPDFSSPEAACAYRSEYYHAGRDWYVEMAPFATWDAQCWVANSAGNFGRNALYLRGDSCPEGESLDLETGMCTPPPECSIPAGTGNELVSQSPLGSSACYQNCLMTTRTSGSVPWIEVNGSRTYFYTGTSTGDYCDSTSGAAPAQPWESYTDEKGCYLGFDGRYCPGGGGDCPNSVTAPNGERFCRMPPDQEECNEAGGSSGEAYCGQDDPNYEEPVPGDGGDDECDPETEDCSGDGGDDGGGEPGDGGGDGGSGDGDGDDDANAPGDGELVGGECTQETRKGPDCSDNMNATECAFGLQLWQARCDQKLAHEDIVGTDEYRYGDSLLSESDANQVGNTEVDFSEALSDLDDSGSGFGGAASCPADRTINLAGFGTIKIPMTFICQWAEKIRPLIIALGWLSAGLIVLSSMRGK